jgi:hypothetical protein
MSLRSVHRLLDFAENPLNYNNLNLSIPTFLRKIPHVSTLSYSYQHNLEQVYLPIWQVLNFSWPNELKMDAICTQLVQIHVRFFLMVLAQGRGVSPSPALLLHV